MHSLETIKFINSPRQSAKIARANTIFNRGPEGHAKAGEKGLPAPGEAGCGHWVTAEEWDRKIARLRRHAAKVLFMNSGGTRRAGKLLATRARESLSEKPAARV